MTRGYWLMHVLLVCVWCSLDTRLISSVNAQSVSITKGSPLGNIFEGDTVELRCDARDLMAGYIIEWTRTVTVNSQPVDELITRIGMNLDSRYTLDILVSSAQNKFETLSFTAIKEDTSVYNCVLLASVDLNSGIVEKSSITLSVNYLPSAMYPICFPGGPFTVQEGTTQHMNCTTERGNPPVPIQILAMDIVYAWVFSAVNDTETRSLALPVTAADNGGSYECKIITDSTIFPNMERSCTIGPIHVSPMTTVSHTTTSMRSNTNEHNVTHTDDSILSTTDMSCNCPSSCCQCQSIPSTTEDSNKLVQQTSPIPLLVAFIVSLILFIVSFIFNIVVVIRYRYLKSSNEKETNAPGADPYMELQPTEDKSRVYMEPSAKETTNAQDTYYQPVEIQDESPEHDYAQTEGSTNTSYEAVRLPQSSAESQYQNINN